MFRVTGTRVAEVLRRLAISGLVSFQDLRAKFNKGIAIILAHSRT